MKSIRFKYDAAFEPEKESDRPFTRINYILMALCVAMIVIGFALMSGGGSPDPDVFNPDIFSTRRIVVGPAIAFLGFLLMAFAIVWTPRSLASADSDKSDDASQTTLKTESENPVGE